MQGGGEGEHTIVSSQSRTELIGDGVYVGGEEWSSEVAHFK